MSNKTLKFEISKLHIAAIISFCVVLIGLNAWLLKQNQELKKINQQLRSSSEVRIGGQLLPLAGIDRQGNEAKLEPSKTEKTLLLVYASTCKFCKQNAPNWEKIMKAAQSKPIRIAAVSLFAEDADVL